MYYYMWITVMLSRYADTLISEMVKLGYTIGPACEGRLMVGNANQPSVIIALRVKSDNLETTPNEIYKDISEVIRKNNIFVYSIVISETATSTWNGSNIVFPVSESKKTDLN